MKALLWQFPRRWTRYRASMPEAIVLDLDDCVVMPDFSAPVKEQIAQQKALVLLRKLAVLSKQGKIPPIFMDTGRDRNYVEAIAFMTGFTGWAAIEGGRRIFNPVTKEMRDHPEITTAAFRAILKLQNQWVLELQAKHPEIFHYPGKKFMVTLEVPLHKRRLTFDEYHMLVKKDPEICQMEEQGLIVVERSQVAPADIGACGEHGPLNKESGLWLIGEEAGVHPSKMLFVGDSSSDGPPAKRAGFVGCPRNATDGFKRITAEQDGHISQHPYAEGVVDIVKHFCRVRI